MFRINEYDPLTARGEIEQKTVFRRGDWAVRIECRTALSCDREQFFITATLDAFEGRERILRREWDETLPRQLV